MKQLEKRPDIADVVTREMRANIDYARKLTVEEAKALQPGRFWVFPWHPVPNPFKKGKWRLVFDARADFAGVSLNERLLKGEVLRVSMLKILLHVREFRIVLCGDVTNMFYQVLVPADDADAYLF